MDHAMFVHLEDQSTRLDSVSKLTFWPRKGPGIRSGFTNNPRLRATASKAFERQITPQLSQLLNQ